MDPAAFDYVAGGAWDEITLAENEAAWRRRRLRPRVLVDVSAVDPSTTMLGAATALPAGHRPDGGARAGAPRRRGRHSQGSGRGRGAIHVVHDVVSLDRGGRGRGPRWHELVPALHPGGPGTHPRARGSRRSRGVQCADRHRGPAASGLSGARPTIRLRAQRARQLRGRARWAHARRRRPCHRGRIRSPRGAARRRADVGRPRQRSGPGRRFRWC